MVTWWQCQLNQMICASSIFNAYFSLFFSHFFVGLIKKLLPKVAIKNSGKIDLFRFPILTRNYTIFSRVLIGKSVGFILK